MTGVAARYQGVLLDAFGTLLQLDDPVGRLRAELGGKLGVDVSAAAVEHALATEIAYYSEHCHEGRDVGSLADLHVRCAAIVLDELAIRADPVRAVKVLGGAFRYRAYDDVAPALDGLRRAGVPVAVVSNADYTLPAMLASAGVHADHVFSSAATGSSKPDPGIFRFAIAALGLPAGRVLHVGDTPAADGDGARAAGIAVRIIDRAQGRAAGTIGSLTEILEMIE
jgi:putative hydrolase of the HAD superfamily